MTPGTARLSGWKPPWPLLLVLLAAAAASAPTIAHQLVWDDPVIVDYVAQVARERGVGGLAQAEFRLGMQDTERLGYYRPVVLLSFQLDALLSRVVPSTYHLTNVLLHTANSGLVFLLLTALLASTPGATFGGLLFALHPVHVESVAFVSGRTDLWAAFFVLLATLAWVRERNDGAGARSATRASVGGICFLLALLSKENSFLLPVVLLAWDALGGVAGRSRAGWWSRNGRWIAVWGAALVLALALRLAVAGVGFGTKADVTPLSEVAAAPLLAARIALKYFRLLAFPWPLSAYYTSADLQHSWFDLLGTSAALSIFAFMARPARTGTGLRGLVWTCGFLVPVLGVVPLAGPIMAERHLYLPSVGFCLAAGGLAAFLTGDDRHGLLARGAGVFLLGAALLGTVLRSLVWQNHFLLYQDMARSSPAAAITRFNFGKALAERGLTEQAKDEYAAAVRAAPRFADAYRGIGEVLMKEGRSAEAAQAFSEAVSLDPDSADKHYSLGLAYLTLDRLEEAAAANLKALARQPRHAMAANNLGVAYSNLGRKAEAIEAFRQSVASDHTCAGCYLNLGLEYAALGRWGEAAAAYAEALRIEPEQAGARLELGRSWLMLGERARAREELRRLERIDAGAAASLRALLAGR